jgi:NitT/TauT family transport system permease protein
MRKRSASSFKLAKIVALIAAIISLWEIAGRLLPFLRFLISTPAEVIFYSSLRYEELLAAMITTGTESIFGLAFAFGFALAAIIAGLYWDTFYRWILPAAIVSQVIPLVSLAPFFILVFGLGLQGKVAMAATMCFFPIFVNFSAGVLGVPQQTKDLLFIYAFSRTQSIFRVYLPLSVPHIFAGLRIAATLAVIGAIVAEFNGADRGLGKNLFLAAKRLEPELMIASLVLSSFLGGTFYWLLNKIERRIGYWYVPNQVFGIEDKL